METYKIREAKLVYGKADALDITVSAPAAISKFVAERFGYCDQERTVVFFLNRKNKIKGWHVATVGTLSKAVLDPSVIFRQAILAGSASVIMYHNHPSGDLTPSREDVDITNRMVAAGKILNIQVLDHVIGDAETSSYYSLRENGCIAD